MTTKNKTLFFIAFLLVIFPFVGFTRAVEDIITICLGLCIGFNTFMHARRNRLLHIISDAKKTSEETIHSVRSTQQDQLEVVDHVAYEHTKETI